MFFRSFRYASSMVFAAYDLGEVSHMTHFL